MKEIPFFLLVAVIVGTFLFAMPNTSDAQIVKRKLSVEASYSFYQRYFNLSIDTEFNESEVLDRSFPLYLGLNYRVAKQFSFYGEFMNTHFYQAPESFSDLDLQRFTAYTIGIMPFTGIFEFGLGYSFLKKNTFLLDPAEDEKTVLTSENLSGLSLRMFLDIPIKSRVSLFGGAIIHSTIYSEDRDENFFGSVNGGLRIYFIKQKPKLPKVDLEALED